MADTIDELYRTLLQPNVAGPVRGQGAYVPQPVAPAPKPYVPPVGRPTGLERLHGLEGKTQVSDPRLLPVGVNTQAIENFVPDPKLHPSQVLTPAQINAMPIEAQQKIAATAPLSEVQVQAQRVEPAAVVESFAQEERPGLLDRINNNFDLASVGMALLAGSDSGQSTLGNLGRALQAGQANIRADRKEQREAVGAEARNRYMDAIAKQAEATAQYIPFKEMTARIKAQGDYQGATLENWTAQKDLVKGDLINLGGLDTDAENLDTAAGTLANAIPNYAQIPLELRNQFWNTAGKKLGDDWWGKGGDVDTEQVFKIAKAWEEFVKGTK